MDRWLLLTIAVYTPHLCEEHFTGMWNDPLIARAFAPLAELAPRQSTYLMFQVMLALALAMTYAFSRGEGGKRLVLVPLALALLGESHHVIRAFVSHSYNSGLATALPMPFVGGWLMWRLALATKPTSKKIVC